jgi:hypothetical protein
MVYHALLLSTVSSLDHVSPPSPPFIYNAYQQHAPTGLSVKIPSDAIIPRAKLTKYLLVPLPEDDKAKFLEIGGFTQENPDALEAAIRQLIAENDAVEAFTDVFGTRYTVTGTLHGVNGVELEAVTVWIVKIEDTIFRFVTLIPMGRT